MADAASLSLPAQDAAARIRAEIEKLYREGVVHCDDGFTKSLYPTSLTPGRGRFLGELARQLAPRATLEVGMGWGLSTLHLLEGLLRAGGPHQPHIVMDPFQHSMLHGGALRAIREAGASNLIEFHEVPSEIHMPKLVEQGRKFDFIFIDGDHRFDGAFVDLVFAHKLLTPGGTVVMDDTEYDSVFLACRFAETNWNYSFVAGHTDRASDDAGRHRYRNARPRPQIAAWRKPMADPERSQHHFNSFVDDFSPYIRANRMRSSRLAQAGLIALRAGDRETARRSFRAALREDPTRVKNIFRYLRTYLPPGMARILSGRGKRSSAD